MDNNQLNRKLTVKGTVDVTMDGNMMLIEAQAGSVTVTVFDTRGLVTWAFHPLSGWYILQDMREQPPLPPVTEPSV